MSEQDRANALLQEGIERAKCGKLDDALRLFDDALEVAPENPVVNYNRGLARQQAGSIEAAIVAYRAATEVQPQFTEAWINLSQALKLLGRFSQALEAAERSVQLDPAEPSAWLAKGNALRGLNALAQAADSFRSGVFADPGDRLLKASLANTIRELGQVPEAIRLLRETIEAHPDFAEAHRDLAHALLLNGEYREGWIENRWRWDTESLQNAKRHQEIPEWKGQPLTSKRILLWDEQGFGDAIQFVRFVPWVAEMGAEVVLEAQPQLVRLFETVAGVGEVIPRGGALPPVDYQVSLIDLGGVFCSEVASIPNETPYVHVGKIYRPPTENRLRVGLCWAGNPCHDNDRNRSMTYETLSPLLELPQIDFVSLQIAQGDCEMSATGNLKESLGDPVDFHETARLVATLDLVITIDSSIAHLAGALGQAVWVLLPYGPDWRWMLGRDDSPWYPGTTLFRQAEPGDWSAPIREISQKITDFFAQK
jgi:hypothetical protein